MNITAFAHQVGCHPDTLRFYDREGILPAHRDPNGYRTYTEDDVARTQLILTLRQAHLSIAEIKVVATLLAAPADHFCQTATYDLVTAKHQEFERLSRFYAALASTTAAIAQAVQNQAPLADILATVQTIGSIPGTSTLERGNPS